MKDVIENTYRTLCSNIPIKQKESDSKDFRSVLRSVLNDYKNNIVQLQKGNIISSEDLKEVDYICGKINDIVKSVYKGLHSTAFSQLSNLLQGAIKHTPLIKSILVYDLNANRSLFRMRKMDNRVDLALKDMFHMPLNKRGDVATHRYSFPGYPCLYLGNSIYSCWEELGRPSMSQSMVSRVENVEVLRLLDLRIPELNSFREHTIDYVKVFPLIIACSVRVKQPKALFKPEYVIPQLLMEYVISQNMKEKKEKKEKKDIPIIGTYYTSVFINNDFGFDMDKFGNIVVPVMSPLSGKQYCKVLSEKFKITMPTCDEWEQARTAGYRILDMNIVNSTLVIKQHNNAGYDYSSFGRLEARLKEETIFPLKTIGDDDYKN